METPEIEFTLSEELSDKWFKEIYEASKGTSVSDDDMMVSYYNRVMVAYMSNYLEFFIWGGVVHTPYGSLKLPAPVKTNDEHDALNPIKPLPRQPYMVTYARLWQQLVFGGYPMTVTEKSRQMKMSWFYCIAYQWLTMFYPGRYFIMSKKEKDSHEQVKRSALVYYHLQPWIKDMFPMKQSRDGSGYMTSYGTFELIDRNTGKEWSRLWGLAQGGGQVRQYTATRIFIDEGREQDELMDTLQAITPTVIQVSGVGNHCGCDIVSSAGPGPFMNIVKDVNTKKQEEILNIGRNDLIIDGKKIELSPSYKEVIEGLSIKQNNNGFVALRLHYTADERKKTEEFTTKARQSYAEDWMWDAEMEISYAARGGHKVFERSWDPKIHLVHPSRIPKNMILYRGVDYGRVHPTCCVWAGIDSRGDCYVIRTYKQRGLGIAENTRNINSMSFGEHYPWTVIDQSTKQVKEEGHASIMQQFMDSGLMGLVPSVKVSGQGSFDPGLQAIYDALQIAKLRASGVDIGGMALYISEQCAHEDGINWEIENIRFKKPRGDTVKTEQTVDEDDDLVDCLRYILLNNPSYYSADLDTDVDRKVKEYGATINAMY